jgi:anti-anti-sigma factor
MSNAGRILDVLRALPRTGEPSAVLGDRQAGAPAPWVSVFRAGLVVSHPTNDLPFDVTTVSADAAGAIIQVRGDLDVAHCQLLAAVLDNHLQLGHRFVHLDLSQLEFLDGSGLRAIVAAHNQFLVARGNLILTNLGPMVVRLLSLTELDQALLIAGGPDYFPRSSIRPTHVAW